jgi:transposase
MGARLVGELFAALDAQTVVVPAEQTIGRVIRDLAIELSRLAAAREPLATEIEAVFMRHPQAPVLLSIPGIGARILSEIGDVTRFPTPGHLAAYAGLAPVTKQSGRSINGEHRRAAAITGAEHVIDSGTLPAVGSAACRDRAATEPTARRNSNGSDDTIRVRERGPLLERQRSPALVPVQASALHEHQPRFARNPGAEGQAAWLTNSPGRFAA